MGNGKGQYTVIAHLRERGFTLYELLVSTLVAGLALLATMLIASQMGSQLHAARGRLSAQDNARVALDEIVRTLRAAGSQTDQARGQGRFVYAGPWTVGLNANLNPIDDPDGTATPMAVDPALGDAAVPLGGSDTYTPPRAYSTGAETIVLTVDSNRDGTVNSADASDDEEEETENPNDMVLKSFVYGSDGATNTVTSTGLALVRGPAAADDGTLPEPIFRYWVDDDNDSSTPEVLHGDTNADGTLSQSEIAALDAVPADDLGLITRIEVAATAENEKTESAPAHGWSVLRSTVSFRNRSTTAARVTGVVFLDHNSNGARDPGEVPLANVVVRCTNGRATKTSTDGTYSFVLPPGEYSIQEVDPVGYTSTTPNMVAIHPPPGGYVEVNFGDHADIGFIHGLVYEDKSKNGRMDPSEDRGIRGVRVFLDTGATANTDSLGEFLFAVTTGNYTVTEVDSTDFASSTPNVVDVNIAAADDSAYVTFGDYKLKNPGTIQGLVYYDEDNDGVHDRQEVGIAGVTLKVDGTESTVTDAQGIFQFVTDEGKHEVTEIDPPNYSSSTLNTLTVDVVANQVVNVEFGDIGQQDVSFQEIRLANTQRALSIGAADMGEDNRSDADIVLGTQYVGGQNDILVWWNQRVNSNTANAAIFAQNPSYQRVLTADVNGLATPLLDANINADVVTVMGGMTNNIAVWLTAASGGTMGQLPSSPSRRYTAALATHVNDVVVGKFDSDTYPDLAIGTSTGAGTGRLEIWHGLGGGNFARNDTGDIYSTVVVPGATLLTETLGEVMSLAVADFNGDGRDDLVVGTRRSSTASVVYLFLSGTPIALEGEVVPIVTQAYYAHTRIVLSGSLNDVLALDMKEDDRRDVDLLVATEYSNLSGQVSLWHNRGNNHFGAGTIPDTTPNDTADPHGSPLSLVATMADNDVYPDIVVGTRNSAAYDGQVLLYRCFGFMPAEGRVASTAGVGEIITMTVADFNKDGAPDLATGTRTSATAGKVVVFFNTRTAL